MNQPQQPSPTDNSRRKSGVAGLIAILVGILLGVLLGVFYGHTMWVASSGMEKKLDILNKTAAQKEQFAKEALQKAEQLEIEGESDGADRLRERAEKLTGHIPIIRKDIAQLEIQIELHNQQLGLGDSADKKDQAYVSSNNFAGFSWELINFTGDLFLQVLKLLVIPLVVTSMICGITSLGDVRKIGRMGGWTIGYYMVTGGIAVIIGIILVQTLQPGKTADDTYAYVPQRVEAKQDTTVLGTMLDVFRGKEVDGRRDPGSGMFPSNIFLAASNMNVLALIVFALVFGGALTTIGDHGQIVIKFFVATNEAVMKMVHLVMFFAPLGIFGLVAANITKNGGGPAFSEEILRISKYVMTVIIGLGLHVLVLATILTFLGKRNPLTYTFNLLRALLTAMSTASSSATLPITMECVKENNKVSNRSASFVLPLGATVNMDGTALYEAVAVIFIAQSLGMEMSSGQLIIIFLTSTLAAVGAAGIPEAGLVTMVIVLTAAGVPLSGIGTILAIDWFLDRMRTTVNVYGDAIGAGVVDRFVGNQANA